VSAIELTGHGDWRVYFNRHSSPDTPWCVSPIGGAWELAVSDVYITTRTNTVYIPKETPDDVDHKPRAWVACTGRLTVRRGVAYIDPESRRSR
jgi:hypothetical protein